METPMTEKHQFQPGDRVVCVDPDPGGLVHRGIEYTVRELSEDGFVRIDGIISRWSPDLAGFYPYRFELVTRPITVDTEWWKQEET
jgi:hypothetical protein